jgi:hypothetical protein
MVPQTTFSVQMRDHGNRAPTAPYNSGSVMQSKEPRCVPFQQKLGTTG